MTLIPQAIAAAAAQRQPDLQTIPFELNDLSPERNFFQVGNVVFVAAASGNIDIALLNNNFIPSKIGRVIQTPFDYSNVAIRRSAGVTGVVTGVLVLGHGSFGDFTDPKLISDIGAAVAGMVGTFDAIEAILRTRLDANTTDIIKAIQQLSLAPYPSYAALATAVTAPLQTGVLVFVVVSSGIPPVSEQWQLRANTGGPLLPGDTTQAAAGRVVPNDYNAASNNRAWWRVS